MEDSGKNKFKVLYALSLAWQMGFLIAVPLAGFILLGMFIDNNLATYPFFVIIGAVLGIAITFYEAYHWMAPFLEDKEKDDVKH